MCKGPKYLLNSNLKYKRQFCFDMIKFFEREPYKEVKTTSLGKVTITRLPNKVPYFIDFAKKIKVDVNRFSDWRGKYPDFKKAHKLCKIMQKHFLIENGLNGLYPPGSFCFVAKNITDMRNQDSIVHKGDKENPLFAATKVTQNELDEYLDHRAKKRQERPGGPLNETEATGTKD